MKGTRNTTALDVLFDAGFYAFYMFGACLVWMVAEAGIVKLLTLCFEISYFNLCVIRALIYTLGVSAMLSLVAFREGYKAARASVFGTLISGILATLVHFIFCLLFSFNPFCAVGLKFITALVKFGTSLSDSAFIGTLNRIDFIPVFFVCGALYSLLMSVFKRLGAYKRLADRAELTADAEKSSSAEE
jgi:hypothetical protein